jgi:hypothetical protein
MFLKKIEWNFILVFNNDRDIVMSLNQSLNFLIGIEDKQTCNGFQENLCMKWLFLDIEVAASNQDAKY